MTHPDDMDAVEEFGVRVADVEYQLRPGGYVVLLNDAREVAIVAAQSGLFLPGGGQERDESPADAAVREALEECGLRIRLHEFVGIADELIFGIAEAAYFRKRCSFFKASIARRVPDAVAEHEVRWVRPPEAAQILVHGSQRWAVRRACGLALERTPGVSAVDRPRRPSPSG